MKSELSSVQILGAVVGIIEAGIETMNHLAGIPNVATMRQMCFKPSFLLFNSIFLLNNVVCFSL